MSLSIRLVVAGLASTVALLAIPQALADSTYTDPAGDSGAAPDITQVAVSDAVGRVAFRVSCPLVASSMVAIYLDANSDGKADFLLGIAVEADGSKSFGVGKANGSSFDFQQGLGDARAVDVPGGFEISVSQAALGLSGSFAFDLESDLFQADAVVASDYAPDGTLPWTYTLATAAPKTAPVAGTVTAIVGKPAAVPARPVAGRRLTLSFPVARSDNGAPYAGAAAVVQASVGGKKVAARVAVSAGKVVVTLTPPAGSRGKRLVVVVGVGAGGTATVRPYTAVVS
jgi:hypothetical protein